MKKYTYDTFRAQYSNDDACLHKLFLNRYGNLKECPECNKATTFKKVKNRRSYQCQQCGFQLYPTAGTVFEKTTTPLSIWFYAIYLHTTTRNGVAAKELERSCSICYKTALRISHQLKKLYAVKSDAPQLEGTVEADETYVGGRIQNKHAWERESIKNSTSPLKKAVVFGMVERGGKAFAKVVTGVKQTDIVPIILDNLSQTSKLVTDNSHIYNPLQAYYEHHVVNHEAGEYARGDVHSNTIENLWSCLKRTIKGTHIHVSRQHLQKYVDEVLFRYVNRNRQDEMFDLILSLV